MARLKALTDKIKKFYQSVEEHDKRIQEWIKESKKPIESIINQSLLLRAVVDENSITDTGYANLPDFKTCLTHNIENSLDEELVHLKKIRDKVLESNEKLYEEQKSIETEFGNLKENNLIDFNELNPCCPSLEYIIVWCCNVWRYYQSFYLRICQTLAYLHYDDEESVSALYQLLKEDSVLKKQIDRIRSFEFSNFEFVRINQ